MGAKKPVALVKGTYSPHLMGASASRHFGIQRCIFLAGMPMPNYPERVVSPDCERHYHQNRGCWLHTKRHRGCATAGSLSMTRPCRPCAKMSSGLGYQPNAKYPTRPSPSIAPKAIHYSEYCWITCETRSIFRADVCVVWSSS